MKPDPQLTCMVAMASATRQRDPEPAAPVARSVVAYAAGTTRSTGAHTEPTTLIVKIVTSAGAAI
jgi:hypothetical protein